MLKQAELMIGHLSAAPSQWPQNALYAHAAITALRSVTLLLQKMLAHEPGFEDWYEDVQKQLSNDPELTFLRDARNYVLKEGALRLQGSYEVRWSEQVPGVEMRGLGPDGPDLWASDPSDPSRAIPLTGGGSPASNSSHTCAWPRCPACQTRPIGS